MLRLKARGFTIPDGNHYDALADLHPAVIACSLILARQTLQGFSLRVETSDCKTCVADEKSHQ